MDEGLLSGLDWALIAAYFGVIFGVAVWAARGEKTRATASDYFLAGRNTGWFVIGASLFASNIGSEHLVGLAGTGAASGVAVGQFEILAALMLLLLGWVFVPFYLASGVYTMPEFLERRYGPAARWYLSLVSILGYVLTKISVTIAAGGIVFEALMGINFWTGALIVVALTGVYTIAGGLRVVLYTDMVQMFVLIGGAAVVTIIGLREAGGWEAVREAAGPGYFSVWKPLSDPDFPWTGILLGAPILGVWYWCTDQFIVQRVLAAPGVAQARRGAIFAGFLKLLPLFIFVIPGVVAHVLAQSGRITLDQPDQALPTLVGTLLPAGLRGLVVAGLLAALMSSLSSVFNSCSTLVTWDLYRKLRPEASERQLVWVGQISTGVMVVFGLLWIPFMQNISPQIYTYLQSVQAYIAPPIAAVFLIGVFWQRVNTSGAMAALIAGFVLGMGRLLAELNKDALGGPLETFATMNFLHFAFFLFAVCSTLLVGVSLATPAPDRQRLANLTYATLDEDALDAAATAPPDRRLNLGLTALLIASVAALWLYFRG